VAVLAQTGEQLQERVHLRGLRGRVAEDERYIFLLLDTRVISPVDKTDFIGGTAEDFLPFITAKAVNTKRGGGDKPDNALG
jgi:hypothetical protein